MPRIAKWRQLSEEEFAQLVAESRSFQDLAQKIGYEKTGGGIQSSLKQAVQERGLDISHFLGQAWNRDNYDYSLFVKNQPKKNGKSVAKPLIHLRGNKCECCGLETWLDQPIKLEVHHKNGDRSDNSLENLQLLCPNCHAQTDNWRAKNIKNKAQQVISEEEFAEALKSTPNIRQALLKLGLTPSGANYERAYAIKEKFKI